METTVPTYWNTTNSSAAYDRTTQVDWIAVMCLSSLLMFAVFWIFISLFIYGHKTRKWRTKSRSDSEKLNAGLIYTCVVVCSVLCLLYYATSFVYVNIGFSDGNNDLCDSVNDLLKSIYALIIFSSYIFLWLRQRTFYSNGMLNVHFSKPVQIFSILSIVIIFLGGLTALLISALPNYTVSSTEGCVDESRNEEGLFWFILCAAGILIFGEVSLLYLLLNALLRSSSSSFCSTLLSSFQCCQKTTQVGSRKEVRRPAFKTSISSIYIDSTDIKQRSRARVKLIIRKTFVFAVFSVIADTLTIVVEYSVSRSGQNKRVAVISAQISSALTLLFLVFSFVSWRQMLTSAFKFKGSMANSDGHTAASQYN